MVGLLTAYLCVLVLAPADLPDWLRDGVLGNLAYLAPLVVLWRRGRAHPEERPWTVPLVVAIGCWTVGANLYAVQSLLTGSVRTPSVSDVGFLAFYALCLTAVLAALREHLRGVRLIVALDGVTGALTGAAVATCFVMPLIHQVWDGSLSAAISLAYPVADVVLVAASLGALAVVGVRHGRQFVFWAAGLVVIGTADIVYVHQLALDHHYSMGTPLDGVWALGVCLIAVGAAAREQSGGRTLPAVGSMAVPTLASVAAVTTLALAPAWKDNALPSTLALLALAGCGLRFGLAHRQVRELAAVRQQALTDELTGAANRRALDAALDARFKAAPEGEGDGPRFGLALIDLDHFKEVNDSFGHAAGDELLRTVVSRFAQALADLETPHLLARLGGDEFAVVLDEVDAQDAVMLCGEALAESLREPVVVDDVALHVQASFGMALAPVHGRDRGDLMFAADAAMYAAKSSGEPICFYSPSSVGDRRQRLAVAEDLYSALERGELIVEYQPILTAAGDLVGAEALVRWDHPTRGRLSPDEFLEVAERYRLTPSIAQRVLDVALEDLHRWRAGGSSVRMSVNVSASDLHDERLVDSVASALIKHDVPPAALTIEITETAMMRDPETARSVMRALDALGVELAVDDYGTGYSSLEYLLRLPINEIKLDRAFSADLADERRSVAIVRSTVDLTHALGLRMVAEGVEDAGTLEILQDLGCDLVQGWHLGRPMPATGFEALFTRPAELTG